NRPVESNFAFDPQTQAWSTRSALPTPRGALSCATVGTTVYAIGGQSPAGDSAAIEAYDPITDTWHTELAPMPTARNHLASAAVDGLIHVVGGRSARLGLTGTAHEVYDPSTNA